MGFLDKVKSQAEQLAKQGQGKLDELQAKKKADGLLRDLGAWHYAQETGRDEGKGSAEIARVVGELRAHEDEHGPLGAPEDAAADATDEAPPTPPPASLPPTTPPPDAPMIGSVPPPPPGVVPPSLEVTEPDPESHGDGL
ncbi:MAG: hypothetical protein JWM05_896 [Acidimicrobiales bacterium]|nr:hypothetical protein [Acidimicrobiales bacterium]